MPRQPRLNLPGELYHVIVRGNEKRSIFRSLFDYKDFLKRFVNGLEESGSACFAWALMPNHIHLLILSGVRGIVSLMHPLLTGYAISFNLRHNRVGHLFQNRYKALICQSESYFQQLVRYIHLNPVKANIVSTPAELLYYPWTGHSALMGKMSAPWQSIDETLSHFGTQTLEARARYERFLLDGWYESEPRHLEGEDRIRLPGENFDNRILGNGDFTERILQQSKQWEDQKIDLKSLSVQRLLEKSSRLCGVPTSAIPSKDRSRAVSKARALSIYAGVRWLNQSLKEMARVTGMSMGCASRALGRGQKWAEQSQFIEQLKRQ